MIVDEFKGSPVDIDLRRGGEHPILVVYLHVSQRHRAIERPVDATDADVQAAFQLVSGDLFNDETLARPGIDQKDGRDDQ